MDSLYLYLGIYVAIILVISYVISRRQSKESFLIAGRNRSEWQILASKFAAAVGAGYFITYTGFAYEYGFGVFAIAAGMLLGYAFFALWAVPRIRKTAKKKFYTFGQFVKEKTKSHNAMIFSDVISGLMLLAWLVVGVIGGGKIISDFGLLSYPTAVLFSAAIVLVYLFLAGFKAVVVTDFIQSIVIFVLLVVVTIGIVNMNIGELFSVEVNSLGIDVLAGFLFYGFFHSFTRPDFFQLIYAAKSTKKAMKGFLLAIIPITLICSFLLLIGLFMLNNIQGLDTALVFSEGLKQFLPASLLPIAIVLFFSGIMSSADTNVYAIASHAASYWKKDKKKMIRLFTIALLLIVSTFAIVYPDIVDVSILAGALTMILPLPIIYLLANGKSAKKFISGAISGTLFLIIGIVLFGLTPVLVATTFLGGGLGLLWPK